MTKELKTTILQLNPTPSQRLLVLGDIKGHLNHLIQLLRKMEFGNDDILIIVGDLIGKNSEDTESLRVVQYVRDLCRHGNVYATIGNAELEMLDLMRDEFPESGSIYEEMLADLGVPIDRVTPENVDDYRRQIREHFQGELDFLANLPTGLTVGDYRFVHGELPMSHLEQPQNTENDLPNAFILPHCKAAKDEIIQINLASEKENLLLVQGSPQPCGWRRERETSCYELLDRLGIPFYRIDHHVANTMELCIDIDAALDAVICKNLFLCNQQRTSFYLLMMPGDKRFKTKELSKQIDSSRLSFAEAIYMEKYLHISPGSVSVMGLMNDSACRVQLLIDRDVLDGEWIGCHPCMNTASIRLKIKDLLEVFLPAIHHEPIFVELTGK